MGRVWSSGVRAMGVVEFAMMQYVEVDYSEVYGTSQENQVSASLFCRNEPISHSSGQLTRQSSISYLTKASKIVFIYLPNSLGIAYYGKKRK